MLLACLGLARAAEPQVTLLEAVRQTLENSPGVNIEKELVVQSEGALQIASGQFDLTTTAGVSLGTNHIPYTTAQKISRAASNLPWLDTFREDTDTYYLGLNQLMRNGVSITPLLSNRSLQNNNDQYDLVNYTEASLRITVPLLKGLGVKATGADELAAGSSLLAARALARHNISRRVYNTIVAFWQLAGSQSMLDTALAGRARSDEFLALINRLIKGGELAPDFSNQAQANVLAREADLARSRLSLFRSGQNLGLAMGYSPRALSDTPPVQAQFPQVPAPGPNASVDRYRLVQKSLDTRLDYRALEKDMDAARILLERADNFLLPDVKASFKGGYAGLSETSGYDRYYTSLSDQASGLNFLAALTVELPLQNNAARGEVVRRQSQLREIKLRLDELANNIAAEVLVALEAVRQAQMEHEMAKQSAEHYRLAVKVATARFKQGEGTINEVLDQEDKYLTAQLTQISAQQKYAVAIAQLRYATGTLLQERDGDLSFQPSCLARMPFTDQEAAPALTR